MANAGLIIPEEPKGQRIMLGPQLYKRIAQLLNAFAGMEGAGNVTISKIGGSWQIVGAPSGSIPPYTLYSVGDDILQVKDAAGNYRYVAKSTQCMRSPFDGNTVNGVAYSYANATTRTSVLSGTTLTEIVTPVWLPNLELIAALPLASPFVLQTSADKTLAGSSVVTLVDVNNGAHAFASTT